jgi:hypothetical protein
MSSTICSKCLVGLVQADHVVDGRQAQARDFGGQRQAVVDHVVGAQFLHPGGRFRTRGRADDGHARQLPRQLHQHGADAARRADHQQGLAVRLLSRLSCRRSNSNSQAVMAVKGRAAAGKVQAGGMWPTMRSSTS